MPARVHESIANNENKNTILLMKLFQQNVKQDISHTSDIIDLIQKKMSDFDFNLDLLKTSTSELNREFADINEKITNLDTSFKRVNSMSSLSTLSRNSSFSSISEISRSSGNETDQDGDGDADGDADADADEELESTFVFVSHDTDNSDVKMEDYKRAKHQSVNNNEAVNIVSGFDAPSNLSEIQRDEYKRIDDNCNQLIELLMKSAYEDSTQTPQKNRI